LPIGELIGAAVGVLLLIIVAYVLIGSTLGGAEVVASAQRDMVHLQEIRSHTDIAITGYSVDNSSSRATPATVSFTIENTGIELINLQHVDVFIVNQMTNTSTENSSVFGNGILNPNAEISGLSMPLDPSDCSVTTTPPSANALPLSIEVVTGNGIYNFAQFVC
jgi:flagellar protein FlaF